VKIVSLIDDIWKGIIEFFLKYFVNETGYNIYNTTVYVTLGLVACYLVYLILHYINRKGKKRWGENFVPVEPNKKFFLAIIPYIFLGATIRALKDTKFIPDTFRLFETPLIYVFMIFYTILVGLFIIWIATRQGTDWKLMFFGVGLLTEIMFLFPLLKIMEPEGILGGLMITTATALFTLLFLSIRYLHTSVYKLTDQDNVFLKKLSQAFSLENILVLMTQMFDASATVISIMFFQYGEKHIIPDFLFSTIGTWVFWPVKFLIVFITLQLMDTLLTDSETELEVKSWLKWIVFLLGLATGTRDTLRLMTQT